MYYKIACILFLIPGLVFGETKVSSHEYKDSPEIRGIVLLDGKESCLTSDELLLVEGVDTSRVNLPGSRSRFVELITPLYENKAWSHANIQLIKQRIYQYYQEERRPFVILSIPGGKKKYGILQIFVDESTLGKVEVVGNQWTSTKRYLNYFHTRPGDPLYEPRLTQDLNFINRNPFRHANLIYSPGAANNTTDLTLQVADRRPYRFYAGFDNTGVPTTGRQRVFAGFSLDQLFGLDHTIFYQYTTNYSAHKFHANTFQYTMFLPLEVILNFYGGFSLVHAKLPSPNRSNKGTNIQGSARCTVPFSPRGTFAQEWTVGFDLKNTNNTVEFVDNSPTFGQTVNISQFMGGYRCQWDKGSAHLEGGAEVYLSPFQWLPNQTSEDFSSLRPNAPNRWIYGTAYFQVRQALPHSCSYQVYLKGQLSEAALLPSEQLGLGGYDSIRGYDPRQYNADSGLLANFEVHSPTFSVIRSKKPNPDAFYFLAFLDAGFGFDRVPVPMVKRQNILAGIGPGFRYHFGPYFSARFDWGFKLHHQEDYTGGWSMVHFSTSGAF